MIKKIIALLLWIIFWLFWYIYNQFDIKNKINKETKLINEKVLNNYEKNAEIIRNNEINNIKKDILKSISLNKIQYKIEITDYFWSFEKFYKKALENKEFYEKTLKKDFLLSKEADIINNIRKNLLKSVISNWYTQETIFWLPENIDCNELNIKSPCIKIKTKFDNLNIIDKKVIFDNRDFTQQDIIDILSWNKSFYK